jgi:DEAD/DEAH box helicase domain-containing protein
MPDKKNRIIDIIEELKDHYKDSIVRIHKVDGKEADYREMPDSIAPVLKAALEELHIPKLYSHQREAFELIQQGKNVVLETPTSSGKTLCYNLPVLDAILKNNDTRAIYIFPTKALSQDQLVNLQAVIKKMGSDIPSFTYDGDTPEDARKTIRNKANIVITNPDMMHSGILPHHTKWVKLFENLKYVVIDELHAYRGVFGSHLANVLRRTKRICEFYGSKPQFIGTSATIANAKEFVEKLTEEPVEIIDKSGSALSEKYIVFYNPPFADRALGVRKSFVKEAERMASFLISNGLRVIVFAPSRLIAEVILMLLKKRWEKNIEDLDTIRGYRGGYLPKKRREIEGQLREGMVKCVVSTNALELGIDIGSLDAVVMASYPGTIASTWQQAGRAGRRDSPALAVLVASNRPIDQYLVSNPQEFLSSSPENALINPDNLHIFVDHVKCSSFELPFRNNEKMGKEYLPTVLEFLKEDGFLHFSKDKFHWIHQSYPANGISLRNISSDNFVVVDATNVANVIAEVDFSSALTQLHPKAIYLCEGKQYSVEKLDFEGRKAYVKAVDSDYFTDAISYTEVTILDQFKTEKYEMSEKSFGEVRVYQQVVGFKKLKFFTMENVGAGDLSLPEYRMHTMAYWLTIKKELMDQLPYTNEHKANALRGIAYALHAMATIMLMCDMKDIYVTVGDTSKEAKIEFFNPQIFIYERYPGGMGLSQPLYEKHDELIKRSLQLLRGCTCENGCPSCISPIPQEGNKVKELSIAILTSLGMGSDLDF